VVASEDCQSLWEADLESDKQSDCLNRVVAAIDVITHKEIVSLRRLTTDLEQLKQVVELSVNVTTNRHRGRDSLDV